MTWYASLLQNLAAAAKTLPPLPSAPGARRQRRSRRRSRRLRLEQLEGRALLSAMPWWDDTSPVAFPASAEPAVAEPSVALRAPAVFLPPPAAAGPEPLGNTTSSAELGLGGQAAKQVSFNATAAEGSEFLLGDVAVTVVLLESNGAIDAQTENWSASRINNVKNEIREGLTWWEDTLATRFPNSPHQLKFHPDFTYADTPVPTPYEPIKRPQRDEALWIDSFLNQVGYNSSASYFQDLRRWNDDQRRASGTHWAFTVFVVDSLADADGMFSDGYFAYAYLGGPFLVMTYDNDGWGISRMGQVLAHETAHIFYALDEYPGSSHYTARSGYYNIQNTNARDGHPNPSSRTASLMAESSLQNIAYPNHTSSVPSLQMVGWRDADGNGIFDVLDVPLMLSGSGSYDASAGGYQFAGFSGVNTLLNANPYSSGRSTTINTVDLLQYRLNGSDWTDGSSYGGYAANLEQVVPVTVAGEYTIDFRTVVGQTGVSSPIWSDTFTVLADGQIRGTKWQDTDGDGVRDPGEPGLAGWTIFLDANQNRQLDPGELATTTDGEGNYSFTGLAAGTYTVAELPLAGWAQTFPATPAADLQVRLDPVTTSLSGALAIAHAGDRSGRLFVAQQNGQVRIVQNGTLLGTPFLNISSKLVTGGERGLLGLAFHPDYATAGAAGEGRFYVYYSAPASSGGDHDSVVAEYRVSAANPNLADPASERVLLRFTQPFSNHNGGDLHFGPDDGLLYISTGDGGSAGDPQNNAQNRANLLGNILRIDVNGTNGPTGQYGIPPSNPFVGQAGVRGEIWAYGFRNPFRMSFDDGPLGAASPDRLFVGDVGQNSWEEVDLVTAGGNYGWRYREGAHPFVGTPPAGLELIDPIAEYANPSVGISVIGGHVYRGREFPELRGKYLFGDLNGRFMALEQTGDAWTRTQLNVQGGNPIGQNIRALGTDEAGELYVATGGSLLKVVSLTGPARHTVTLAADQVVAGVDFGNQQLSRPPVVVSPIGELVVDEDAASTVIDLVSVFADPDPGDILTYSVTVSASPADVVQQISQASYTHIHQDLLYTRAGDNRGFGPEHDLARDNIFQYFVGLGLETELDPFTYSGQTYYNVVATLPGTTRPEDIYIVGAHYDSVNNPGADDNGSGTAAVLEAARVLSQYTFDATLQFIAFDREEQGLIGSASYAAKAQARGDQIQRMVNLDMIGYNPGGLNQVRLYDGDNHVQQLIPELLAAFNVAGYGGPVTAINSGTTSRSDHYSFDVRGYDAALVIESAWQSNPHYHKATDSVETNYLDYAFATHVTTAVAGYLAEAAGVQSVTELVTATIQGSQLLLEWGPDQNGTGSVTVRATDSSGLWVEEVFGVRVNPVADAPRVLVPLEDITVAMGAPEMRFELHDVFADADAAPNGDWLTWSVVSNTNPALVTPSVDGSRLTLAYQANQHGTAEITVRATDSTGQYVDDTFGVTVEEFGENTYIMDNTNLGFSSVGSWAAWSGGFQGNYLFSPKGSGSSTATWTFAGLPSGAYRVWATWAPHANRATDAPFTVLDGNTALGTVRLNQELAPNDLLAGGAVWEELGQPYLVSSGMLRVRLTNAADEYVVADAIRIQRVDEPSSEPEIQVTQGGTVLLDGASNVGFGITQLGVPLHRTFTVHNVGTAPLKLQEPITVPSGFSVVASFGSLSVTPGGATDFVLQLDAAAMGTYGGTVSFGNDDADEAPFSFSVSGSVVDLPPAQILDNQDSGFTTAGNWPLYPGGYGGDYRYSAKGSGSNAATWTFAGLPGGLYQVWATWAPHFNRATDAPFTVFDGNSALGTVRVNQELVPGDLQADAANWALLGEPWFISSGTLRVRLTNAADEFVIADAIRIQRFDQSAAEPEIQVSQDGADVVDGVSSLAFGTTQPGAAVSKTFHVRNLGNSILSLQEPIAVPPGYSVATTFGELELPPGGSTTFVLQLDAAAAGTYSGEVSFRNNDPDEDPFSFHVSGSVVSSSMVQILDNGGSGFSTVGTWGAVAGGFGGDYLYRAQGSGSSSATWSFTGLATGLYRVWATWAPYFNRATDAPFTIYDGSSPLATVRINQELAPDDLQADGAAWELLGEAYAVSSGTLRVRLTNAADEFVIADAIRIERIG